MKPKILISIHNVHFTQAMGNHMISWFLLRLFFKKSWMKKQRSFESHINIAIFGQRRLQFSKNKRSYNTITDIRVYIRIAINRLISSNNFSMTVNATVHFYLFILSPRAPYLFIVWKGTIKEKVGQEVRNFKLY